MSAQTFVEWVQSIYAQRYTGKITIDFFNGVPRAWERSGPRELFAEPPGTQKVDKRENPRDALTV